MIRGRSVKRFRYHVLMDFQNRGACESASAQYVQYAGCTLGATFDSDDEGWGDRLNTPGVSFFRVDNRPGGGRTLLSTNHPLFGSLVGQPFDWSFAVNALRLVQE